MVIVADWPEFSVPRAHGYGVAHAPLLETKFRPAGVGSVTKTFPALSGPLFVTVTEYVTFVPGVNDAGPLFVIERSALAVTGVVTDELSFVPFGSVAPEVTDAVFVIDVPA